MPPVKPYPVLEDRPYPPLEDLPILADEAYVVDRPPAPPADELIKPEVREALHEAIQAHIAQHARPAVQVVGMAPPVVNYLGVGKRIDRVYQEIKIDWEAPDIKHLYEPQPGPEPTPAAKPHTATPPATDTSRPRSRVSAFGGTFPHSDKTQWAYYDGAGWVHRDEETSFRVKFGFCEATQRWWPQGQGLLMLTINDKLVNQAEADKLGWVRCALSSRYAAPDDQTELLNLEKELVKVSRSFLVRSGGPRTCDYYQLAFVPMAVKAVKSARYKAVSVHALRQSGLFRQCYGCAGWADKGLIPIRADLGGQLICDPCYYAAIKPNVMLAHNAEDYPAPISVPGERLNCVVRDGRVCISREPSWDDFAAARLYGVEVELEMDIDGMRRDGLNRVMLAVALKDALGPDFVTIKEDSTLNLNGKYSDQKDPGLNYAGFEVVSAPSNLVVHRERWSRIKQARGYQHLRSWDTETCGFHVHIARRAFTTLQVGRVLRLINHPANQLFVQKVAGRKGGRWWVYRERQFTDALYPSRVDSPDEPKPRDRSRRVAVNLARPDTVEFRLFRGTINPRHIVRNIEFCDAVCDFCYPSSRSLSEMEDYHNLLDFVSGSRKRWPMLAEWLALHNLIPGRTPGERADLSRLTLKPSTVEEGEMKVAD